MATHSTANDVWKIVKDTKGKLTTKGRQFVPGAHDAAKNAEIVYNLVESSKSMDNEFIPVDVSQLSKPALDEMVARLNQVQFDDGESFGSMARQHMLDKFQVETGRNSWENIIKPGLLELSNFGVPITLDKTSGKLRWPGFSAVDKADYNTISEVDALMHKMSNVDYVDLIGGQQADIKTITPDKMKSITQKIDQIKDRLGEEHNVKLSFDDLSSNEYVDAIVRARNFENNDRLFKFMNGSTRNQEALNTLSAIDRLFTDNKDGLYLKSAEHYKVVPDEKSLASANDQKKAELISRASEVDSQLKNVFRLMSRRSARRSTSNITKEVELSDAQLVVSQVDNMMKGVSRDLQYSYKTNGSDLQDYYTRRIMESNNRDVRAVAVYDNMVSEGFGFIGNEGKLHVWDPENLFEQQKLDGMDLSAAEVNKLQSQYKEMLNVLGSENVIKDPMLNYNTDNPRVSNVGIDMIPDLYKSMQSKSVDRFKINALEAMDRLDNSTPMVAQKSMEIVDQISRINETKGLEVDLPTEIISINKKISDLKDMFDSKSPVMKDLNKLTKSITKIQKDWRGDPDNWLDTEGQMLDTHEVLRNILYKEHEVRNRFQETVNRLITLSNNKDLTKPEIADLRDRLTAHMYKQLKTPEDSSVKKSFEELVEDYNDTLSWRDGIDNVISAINDEINIKLAVNRVDADAYNAMQYNDHIEGINSTTIKEHQSITPMSFAHRRGLTDKNNSSKIDPGFISLLNNNPKEAFKVVRNNIYKDKTASSTEKGAEWAKFRSEEAPALINYIKSSAIRSTAEL